MQLIGQTVRHQVFGNGIVTDKREGTLTVSFPVGEKMFLYPDAFSKYLVLQNTQMQGKILDGIKAQKEAAQKREQAAEAKWVHESRLRHMKISPRAQGVFNIRQDEEEQVFSQWCVSTGTYLSGLSKGEPRIPDRMKPNSMCILTVRPDGAPETQRRITGVFMVGDEFNGSKCADGIIRSHPEYRLRLTSSPLFWPYITQYTAKQKWGNTTFKYIQNSIGEKILCDLREQSEQAEAFYQYYCRLNQLPPSPAKKEA